MDHNWNLIPPIVDLLDGYFEIILLPFFLDIELKVWVPRAPLSSLNLIPISCIKNPESATISWTMLFALLATFQSADTPPPVYSKPPFNGQTFYICLASTLVPGDLLVDLFLQIFSTSSQTTRDLFTPFSGWSSSSPSKGITLYLTMESDKLQHYIPLKGRNKES